MPGKIEKKQDEGKIMNYLETVNSSLVKVAGEKVMTDSLMVAHNFGKRHDNVMQKIESLVRSDKFNRLNFKVVKYEDGKGESRKKYIMNRRSFSILVMGFTGEKAMKWKHVFYDAFEAMEEILTRQKNLEWQECRQIGKAKRHDLTDSIRKVVKLAERQGSKNANRYYTIFTRLIYGLVFGAKTVPGNFRDMLDEQALHKLRLIEEHAALWIDEATRHGVNDYHAPYQVLKCRLPMLLDVMGGLELE